VAGIFLFNTIVADRENNSVVIRGMTKLASFALFKVFQEPRYEDRC
jgi:hypothetical protein